MSGDPTDDTDTTPTDLDLRRPFSPERLAFARTELSLDALIRSVREIRRRWAVAHADERRAMAAHVEADARELGDIAHDLARLMSEFKHG